MKLRAMIFVTDFDRAKQFYVGVLGFGLREQAPRHLVFSRDGVELRAFLCERHGQVGDYANEARSVLVFEVDSVERVMREMKGKGVRFIHDRPAANDWGRYAAFVDPFGIVHEIFEAHAT
jgi:catechol 2,3-dioxygenase-like lactoylglutathione lyase family enzyme